MTFFSKPIDLRQELMDADHKGIHNFSYGSFEAYFNLNKSGYVTWDRVCKILLIYERGRSKTWQFYVYEPNYAALASYHRTGPIYSQIKLDIPNQAKFNEIAYDLKEVFDPNSYNKKKRYQRITYPSRWLQANNIEIRNQANKSDIELLHREWAEWKLAQPKTYRLLFPSKRYLNCALLAMQHPEYYKTYAAYHNEQLIAIRILYLEKHYAFDLANFGIYFRMPSNMQEYFCSATMQDLYANHNISMLNAGTTRLGSSIMDRQLECFKHHWPYQIIQSYMYARQKQDNYI